MTYLVIDNSQLPMSGRGNGDEIRSSTTRSKRQETIAEVNKENREVTVCEPKDEL